MTDPVESLARALTDVTWRQGWAGLSQDARTIALSETRTALTRAAGDITEAIAQSVDEHLEHADWCGFLGTPCCCWVRDVVATVREWTP